MRQIIIHSNHPIENFTDCEADVVVFGETIKCGEPSVALVTVDGLTRYVCMRHLDFLRKEQGTLKE